MSGLKNLTVIVASMVLLITIAACGSGGGGGGAPVTGLETAENTQLLNE